MRINPWTDAGASQVPWEVSSRYEQMMTTNHLSRMTVIFFGTSKIPAVPGRAKVRLSTMVSLTHDKHRDPSSHSYLPTPPLDRLGKTNTKRLPSPGLLSTHIFPPCSSTISL